MTELLLDNSFSSKHLSPRTC